MKQVQEIFCRLNEVNHFEGFIYVCVVEFSGIAGINTHAVALISLSCLSQDLIRIYNFRPINSLENLLQLYQLTNENALKLFLHPKINITIS